MSSAVQPLPAGSVLLHIGPYKTGTTALQGAFHTSRPALEAAGVHYCGRNRQPMLAALAMTGRPGRKGDPKAEPRHWQALVEEVEAHAGRMRVVVSSEFLSDAADDVIPKVIDGLGGDRVHVVLTLRPLVKIMPSQWQQYVQNGLRVGYDDWLDHMLNKPPYEAPSPTFWRRHRHAELLRRWVDVAGAERVTAIAVDDTDRNMLIRTFEDLLDVPQGTLTPEQGLSNRSLSGSEVELVRQLNAEFKRRKWGDDLYGRVVRNAVVKPLLSSRQPDPDEPGITTPRWAQERAAEIGESMANDIAATGVRVIGDLSVLHRLPPAGETPPAPPVLKLPVDVVALTVLNAIAATRRDPVSKLAQQHKKQTGEDRPVSAVSTSKLFGVAFGRLGRRLRIKARGARSKASR